jgi:hypothetical protein
MTSAAKAVLAYLVVALIVFAWMFRYNVSDSGGSVMMADRWT